MKDVNNFINSLEIYDDDKVVLACSYGPDSMCLLDILIKNHFNVVVAHVNHKLRKESDQEYLDLEDYCHKNNIIFEGTIIDKNPEGNSEEYYRNFRYDFFKKIMSKYKAKYLFTAHHGDDLVETILMRLSRGASFSGYAGFKMLSKVDNYMIARPLIYLTKDEIMDYVNNNHIPYSIDATNLTDDYTRNRYRHSILPVLKEINPKVHQKYLKFSNTLNEYNDYIENEVKNLYSKLYLNNRLDLNEFNILPSLLKKELLRYILLNLYQNNINSINDKHLYLIFDLIENDKRNCFINLPNNIIVSKYYNILEFNYNNEYEGYDHILEDSIDIDNYHIFKVDQTDLIKSNYLIRLNSKEISLPLHVRTRLTADKMALKNGTKKVGEILSEKKLSTKERNRIPIVCDGEEKILWIPGIKKSKFDKQITEEYDIILKCIKKGEKNEE